MGCQTSAVAAPLRHSQAAGSKAKQAFPQWLVVTRYNLVDDGRQLTFWQRDRGKRAGFSSRSLL